MRVALDAAAAEHAVFPLRPRSKKPAIVEWEASATTDPDQIRQWWLQGPQNVGIACGPSGLLVVDLDTPHYSHAVEADEPQGGREMLAALAAAAGEAFPDHTYTVATPTGGQHLYFAAPPELELRCTVGRLGRWIDTRGAGGYVVAAGSVRPEGRYRLHRDALIAPLPQWIIEALTPHPAVESTGLRLPPERAAAYVAAVVRGEADAVARAVTGQRHHTLLRAAGALGRLVGGQELDYAAAENTLRHAVEGHLGRDGFTPDEADTTIRAGLAWGIQRPRHITDTHHRPAQD
ncbi:bifunctional DNA primase/polymerase [Saccharopolyspora mangrovi]|uniref:Bifunctional DNA primase/polymerase n=1 Tax=Saccharopolyspora mangrovi TaxID=3082379 RepID=A0ABU6ALW3_9PSEU|nr:bifunctional DNA primase/polymerase [Saccharopolyspora sp. S2-29]MEB3372433.1 bifunctional DNA primase/polymerase [Saccharopolyspora sp. S2-29]